MKSAETTTTNIPRGLMKYYDAARAAENCPEEIWNQLPNAILVDYLKKFRLSVTAKSSPSSQPSKWELKMQPSTGDIIQRNAQKSTRRTVN